VDFDQVIKRRRMIREFSDRPISRDVIERIVDAARRGPSAGFSQGIEFVVVTEPQRRAELVAIAAVGQKMRAGLEPAPAHIVLCVSADVYRRRYREPDKQRVRAHMSDDDLWHVPFWWVDAGAAMMLLLLAAGNEGLASFFYGVWRTADLASLLALPDEYTPAGIVTVGHRAADELAVGSAVARRRRPSSEVVHWERW
jgi:nitroreductase